MIGDFQLSFHICFHDYIACAGSSGREGRPPRSEGAFPGGRGRQADAAALAAAAASLNTFKGDGSFLESFQQAAAGKPLTDTLNSGSPATEVQLVLPG